MLKPETFNINDTQVEKEKKELLFTVITKQIDLCRLMIQRRECKEFQIPEPSPSTWNSSKSPSTWGSQRKQKDTGFCRISSLKKAEPTKEAPKKEEPVIIN